MPGEQLLVTEGKDRGEAVEVEGELHIGRAATQTEGRLGDDPMLSRQHAKITRAPNGQLTIEDLGSANGTFVNDERIDSERTLGLGDLVRVGHTVLQVTDPSGGVPERTRLEGALPADLAAEPGEELLVAEGAARGQRIALENEFLVGRAMGEDGRLGDDPELSRRHARVSRDGGRLTIEDLGSANGTFVNGERLTGPRPLAVGDSVRMGQTTLEVVAPGEATEMHDPVGPPTSPARGAQPPAAAPDHPPTAPEPAARPPQSPQPQSPQSPQPQSPQPARPPSAPPPQPAARPHTPARPPTPARAPAPPPAPVPAPSGDTADDLELGTVFAGCRVEEIIGRGDMGVVYRADELALQRPVALKIIRPENSREERFRQRFQRESRTAASIDHPNVIPILEAGDQDGVLFITMRLVEGTDLRALISGQGRVDPQRAARIVRQVGAGLDAAHKQGLVHRDVKPANVLLARADHVYLSDFGLAKQETEGGGLTRQGSIVARAEYVAPEQITEDRVDARTDVYALGCLLFESLTGQAPYAGQAGNAMMAHVEQPPPSAVAAMPGLPPAFDEVIGRAMAKDPNQRYTSAGDLGEAALVAAGEQRQAGAESIVATGDAAFAEALRSAQSPPAAAPAPAQAPAPVQAQAPLQPQAPAAASAPDTAAQKPAKAAKGKGGNAVPFLIAVGVLVVLLVLVFVALSAIAKL